MKTLELQIKAGSTIDDLLQEFDGLITVKRKYKALDGFYSVSLDDRLTIEEVQRSRHIECSCDGDLPVYGGQTIAHDGVLSEAGDNDQWGIGRIITRRNPWFNRRRQFQMDFPKAVTFEPEFTGEGVAIYVVDSGVSFSLDEIFGDPPRGESIFFVSGLSDGDDEHGHGTAVAAVAAGDIYGVAREATIYSARVLDENNTGNIAGFAAGIDESLDHYENGSLPGVMNLSLVASSTSGSFNQALMNAVKNAGMIAVACAGNGFDSLDTTDVYPASFNNVYVAGASDIYDAIMLHPNAALTSGLLAGVGSNWGSKVDIFAPGSNLVIPTFDGARRIWSGTSFAAPHVCGVLACLIENEAKLDDAEAVDSVLARLERLSTKKSLRIAQANTTNRLLYLPHPAVEPFVPDPVDPDPETEWEYDLSEQAGEPLPGGKIFRATSPSGNPGVSYDPAGTPEDVEVLMLVSANLTTTSSRQRLFVRGSGTGDETFYFVEASGSSGGLVQLAKFVDGSFTSLGSINGRHLGPGPSRKLWLRLRAEGSNIKGKVWSNHFPEPENWTFDVTDTSITGGGWCGLAYRANSNFLFYFSYDTGGGTAPMPDQTPGTNQGSTNFGNLDTGSGTPNTDWTRRWSSADSDLRVFDKVNSNLPLGFGYFWDTGNYIITQFESPVSAYQVSATANRRRFWPVLESGELDDCEVEGLFRVASLEGDQFRLHLRCLESPDINDENGYFLNFTNGNARIFKYTDGDAISVSALAESAYTTGTFYRSRLQAIGTTLRAKVWPDSDPEPSSWLLEATDSDHSSGYAGWGVFNRFGSLRVSYIKVTDLST